MTTTATGARHVEADPGRSAAAGLKEHHAHVDVRSQDPRRGQAQAQPRAPENPRRHRVDREDPGRHCERLHEQQGGRGIVQAQERRDQEVVERHVVREHRHAHDGVQERLAVRHQPMRLVEEAEVAAAAGERPVAMCGLREEGRGRDREQRGQGPSWKGRLAFRRRRQRPGRGRGRHRRNTKKVGSGATVISCPERADAARTGWVRASPFRNARRPRPRLRRPGWDETPASGPTRATEAVRRRRRLSAGWLRAYFGAASVSSRGHGRASIGRANPRARARAGGADWAVGSAPRSRGSSQRRRRERVRARSR